MSPYLIGLAGRAGSGKNTAAMMLQQLLPGPPVEMSFAASIKRICREVFDFSEAQVNGAEKEVPDPRYPRADGSCLTPREAMQLRGTEWGRRCYPNIWTELALRDAARVLEAGRGVIFTDVRFFNEARAIRERKGCIIRLKRPGADGTVSAHPSELEVDTHEFHTQVSIYLHNYGDLELLRDEVKMAVRLLEMSP